MPVNLPNLGSFEADSGMIPLASSTDGSFKTGQDGVTNILATGDRKVEFIGFRDRTLAYVRSAMGYPAYYMVQPVALKKPVKAVLMDLDGTSVRSEHFWIWIIEKTTASLLRVQLSSWKNQTYRMSPATAFRNTFNTALRSTAPERRSKKPASSTFSIRTTR